jgi:YVTN family beta-propeller protein
MLFVIVIALLNNNVYAQTIDTITKQQKMLKMNPQIEVDNYPSAIAVNDVTNKIYVANYGSDTVSIIDSNSGNLTNVFVGAGPKSITINENTNKIYVSNSKSNSVSVIDGTSNKKIKDISVGIEPVHLVTDNANKIYVSNSKSNSVSVIDGTSDKKIKDISVNDPKYLLYDLGGVYVANYYENSVSVIDTFTDNVSTILNVDILPIYIIRADDVHIYIANNSPKSNSITSIFSVSPKHDTFKTVMENFRVSLNRTINGKENYLFLDRGYIPAMAMDHHIHYSSVERHYRNHSAVNLGKPNKSDSIAGGYVDKTINVGSRPVSMAFNKLTHILYVANNGSNTVSAIDTSLNKVVAGVTFHTKPENSGSILCNNEEYPINIHIYMPFGTKCFVKPNNGFEFSNWIENLNPTSTLQLNSLDSYDSPFIFILKSLGIYHSSALNFTVTKYGTFTANFKSLPPPISQENLIGLYTIGATIFIGWFVPNIARWLNSILQRRHMMQYLLKLTHIDMVDEKCLLLVEDLQEKITFAYATGKINEAHYKLLNEKISYIKNNKDNNNNK